VAYSGLLTGPVVIGAIASGVGLRDALLVPAALALLVTVLAGVMSPHDDGGTSRRSSRRKSSSVPRP
jgi:hypothetical protein